MKRKDACNRCQCKDDLGEVREVLEWVTESNRQRRKGGSMASLFRGPKSADPLGFSPQDCIPQTPGYPTSKTEADETAR